jgi:hypothetical protein
MQVLLAVLVAILFLWLGAYAILYLSMAWISLSDKFHQLTKGKWL